MPLPAEMCFSLYLYEHAAHCGKCWQMSCAVMGAITTVPSQPSPTKRRSVTTFFTYSVFFSPVFLTAWTHDS